MLSAKYVRGIISVIKEEEHINKEINIFTITTVEYYLNKFFNRKFKLNGTIYHSNPFNSEGFFGNRNKDLVVFINNGKTKKNLVSIIDTFYHELEHYKQLKLDLTNYQDFVIYMEKIIKKYNKLDYKVNHDQYMYEIKANLSGVKQAYSFINTHQLIGIDLQKDSEYLKTLEYIYKYDYCNYNYYDTLEKFIRIYKEHQDTIELPDYFKLFLNEDGSYKSINEILNNKSNISSPIYIIFGTDHFRNNIDLLNLSKADKDILEKAEKRRLEYKKIKKNNYEELIKNIFTFKYEDNKKIYRLLLNDRINRYNEEILEDGIKRR